MLKALYTVYMQQSKLKFFQWFSSLFLKDFNQNDRPQKDGWLLTTVSSTDKLSKH